MWCLVCHRVLSDRLIQANQVLCKTCGTSAQRIYPCVQFTEELGKKIRQDLEEGLICLRCWSVLTRCDFCHVDESTCPQCQPEGMCVVCEDAFPFEEPMLVLNELNTFKRCGRCFSLFISNQSTVPSKCGTRKIHKFQKHCGRKSAYSQY